MDALLATVSAAAGTPTAASEAPATTSATGVVSDMSPSEAVSTATATTSTGRFVSLLRSQRRRSQQPQQQQQQQPALESVEPAKQVRRLLLWNQVATWQQHGSELIHTGYREAVPSVAACFHSWTYLHNESVNIISHAAGAVLFVSLLIALFLWCWPWTTTETSYPGNSLGDRLAAAAYCAGVALCFALSAAFHTLTAHSHAYYQRWMALDIAGILVLMSGATVPLIHFGLACGPAPVRWAFHTATALLGGLCAAVAAGVTPAGKCFSLLAAFQGPAHGRRRAALFAGFAAASFLGPLGWASWVLRDPDWPRRVDLWPGVLGTLFFNTVGCVAYSLKFPEYWFPRRFDLVGASHQIMHVAVLAAAVVYAVGTDRALAFRRGEGAACRNGFVA